MRRMHGVLLIVLLFTSVSAYQGVGNLPLRLHFSLARVSRAPRSRVLPAFHSLKAATALVAAENKKHNGFMHVECPDRVGVMWDSFVKSGMCAVSFFLHTFASRLWHMAISAPMMSVAVNRDRRRLHGPRSQSRVGGRAAACAYERVRRVGAIRYRRARCEHVLPQKGRHLLHCCPSGCWRHDPGCLRTHVHGFAAKSRFFVHTFVLTRGLAQVTEAVCGGKADNGFCATRPPGHHAEPEHMMGFCIFNRIFWRSILSS